MERDFTYIYQKKPESRIKKRIAKYVARYIRHPTVANTTIRTDTMEKRSHSGMGVMMAREFIKALIQHIPDRNFKMIRYYDEYSRIIKGKYSGYFRELYKTSDI
ncbi:MAG TPA: hypothetical protein ENF23_02875 [Methanosarcinales archaeon]|nr:hypothetical protein [Methanosarcinales archaeon]